MALQPQAQAQEQTQRPLYPEVDMISEATGSRKWLASNLAITAESTSDLLTPLAESLDGEGYTPQQKAAVYLESLGSQINQTISDFSVNQQQADTLNTSSKNNLDIVARSYYQRSDIAGSYRNQPPMSRSLNAVQRGVLQTAMVQMGVGKRQLAYSDMAEALLDNPNLSFKETVGVVQNSLSGFDETMNAANPSYAITADNANSPSRFNENLLNAAKENRFFDMGALPSSVTNATSSNDMDILYDAVNDNAHLNSALLDANFIKDVIDVDDYQLAQDGQPQVLRTAIIHNTMDEYLAFTRQNRRPDNADNPIYNEERQADKTSLRDVARTHYNDSPDLPNFIEQAPLSSSLPTQYGDGINRILSRQPVGTQQYVFSRLEEAVNDNPSLGLNETMSVIRDGLSQVDEVSSGLNGNYNSQLDAFNAELGSAAPVSRAIQESTSMVDLTAAPIEAIEPAIETTPVVEPAPVVEPEVVEPEPVVEPAPVVEPEVVELEPVVEPEVVEPEPVVEPAIETTPVVEPAPVVEPTPVVEPAIETTPVVEPAPVVEPEVVEPEPVVEPAIETTPVVEPAPAIETTPVVEPAPVVEPEVVEPAIELNRNLSPNQTTSANKGSDMAIEPQSTNPVVNEDQANTNDNSPAQTPRTAPQEDFDDPLGLDMSDDELEQDQEADRVMEEITNTLSNTPIETPATTQASISIPPNNDDNNQHYDDQNYQPMDIDYTDMPNPNDFYGYDDNGATQPAGQFEQGASSTPSVETPSSKPTPPTTETPAKSNKNTTPSVNNSASVADSTHDRSEVEILAAVLEKNKYYSQGGFDVGRIEDELVLATKPLEERDKDDISKAMKVAILHTELERHTNELKEGLLSADDVTVKDKEVINKSAEDGLESVMRQHLKESKSLGNYIEADSATKIKGISRPQQEVLLASTINIPQGARQYALSELNNALKESPRMAFEDAANNIRQSLSNFDETYKTINPDHSPTLDSFNTTLDQKIVESNAKNTKQITNPAFTNNQNTTVNNANNGNANSNSNQDANPQKDPRFNADKEIPDPATPPQIQSVNSGTSFSIFGGGMTTAQPSPKDQERNPAAQWFSHIKPETDDDGAKNTATNDDGTKNTATNDDGTKNTATNDDGAKNTATNDDGAESNALGAGSVVGAAAALAAQKAQEQALAAQQAQPQAQPIPASTTENDDSVEVTDTQVETPKEKDSKKSNAKQGEHDGLTDDQVLVDGAIQALKGGGNTDAAATPDRTPPEVDSSANPLDAESKSELEGATPKPTDSEGNAPKPPAPKDTPKPAAPTPTQYFNDTYADDLHNGLIKHHESLMEKYADGVTTDQELYSETEKFLESHKELNKHAAELANSKTHDADALELYKKGLEETTRLKDDIYAEADKRSLLDPDHPQNIEAAKLSEDKDKKSGLGAKFDEANEGMKKALESITNALNKAMSVVASVFSGKPK